MLKNTNNFNYMFARLISVAYKPLILAYLSFFSTKTILNEFAIVFLFSTLATIGSGFSTYRDFYLHKFSAKKIKIKEINEAFSKYLNSLIVTTIGITIIFFFLAINNIFSLKLYVPIILIFLIEKIWDEVQRYSIVKKKISFWSIFTIAKTIISFISLLISATQTSFSLLLFWSVLNFILVAIFYMFLIYRINIDLFLFKFNLVAGFEYAARHIRFLIIGVMINSLGYLDRIISYFFLLNNIGHISILSMIFSALPSLVHFFFITEKKKEILNNTITVFDFFKSKQFYKILILGFFGCLTLSITFKIIGIINLELTMIFLVGFIQLFNALSLLLIENFFWKKNYYMIIVVDFIFWISIILLFYLLRDILIIKGAYLILNIFLLIRIIFYLYLSKYK